MIEAKDIRKSYNGEEVLRGISLTVNDGDFVSIMGESGSGKSTLISILGGHLSPDSGRVLWNGEDISSFSARDVSKKRCTELGFVFQSFRLIPTLNINDNILLPATLGGMDRRSMLDERDMLTEELGISHLLGKYPDELSGGQCQRAAIARALIYRPHTVILDEPTGALDSAMVDRVMKLLKRLNEERGTTVVEVTHSKRVSEYGHKTIYISDGVIVK